MLRKLWFFLCSLSFAAGHAELYFTPEMCSSHLAGYSDEEVQLIGKDLEVVRSVCFSETQGTSAPFYLATAGAPGSRKTTILERFVATHPEFQRGVYLDPDARALRYMVHTYYSRSLTPLVISEADSFDEVIKDAYEKWRGGSNYIALMLLEEAFAAGRSVVHGATSTGGHTGDFYRRLKENDYRIVLLLCGCTDSLREEAVRYRNNVTRFYQSAPDEVVSKGLLFSERMATYFAGANEIHLFWSDGLFVPERLAAVWLNGELEVVDPNAMKLFKDKYESDRRVLQGSGKQIPSFDEIVSMS